MMIFEYVMHKNKVNICKGSRQIKIQVQMILKQQTTHMMRMLIITVESNFSNKGELQSAIKEYKITFRLAVSLYKYSKLEIFDAIKATVSYTKIRLSGIQFKYHFIPPGRESFMTP